MKLGGEDFAKLVNETLWEQKWNKDSETPRDYSKEYNAPGSKEQDERNKRKRDKRKHDKEFGECPENQDLHHVDGIENDEVKCEPPYINRGRKEKSRLKNGEIVIKIKEHEVRKIVQEETEKVLTEIAPVLMGLAGLGRAAASGLAKVGSAAARGAGKLGQAAVKGAQKAASAVGKKVGDMAKEKAMQKAADFTTPSTLQGKKLDKSMGSQPVKDYDTLSDMINQVLSQASGQNLKGKPDELLQQLIPAIQQLKIGKDMDNMALVKQDEPLSSRDKPIGFPPATAQDKATQFTARLTAGPGAVATKKDKTAGVDAQGKAVKKRTKAEIEAEFAASPLSNLLKKKKAAFKTQHGFELEESQDAVVKELFDLVVKSSQ